MRYSGSYRWVAFCTVLSLLFGLLAFPQPSYALAETAAVDRQEGQLGGVIDSPGAEGVEWRLSEDGVLRVYSEGKDQACNIGREEAPWYPYCSQVKKVVIGPGITELQAYVFEGYTSLESLELCEGMQRVGSFCFADCISLTEIVLPESFRDISDRAFKDCSSLTSVDLPKQMQTIDMYAFYRCDHLKTVRFPETLAKLEISAFEGCSALEAVHLPDGITVLQDLAFSQCKSVKEVFFPETLAKIGNQAFYNATELTSVHFPASVKQIGENSFAGSEKLSSLYFDGNAPEIEKSAFLDVTATAFYPTGDATWTEDVMQDYGGMIRWCPWDPATGELGKIRISDSDMMLVSDRLVFDYYKEQYPEVTVVCQGKKLVQGTDYVMAPGKMQPVYPGVYEIKIIGQGEYCGVVTKSFEIEKQEPKMRFVSSYVRKQTNSSPFINELKEWSSDMEMTYTSSDPGIASVDNSGKVTIHGAGEVDITVNVAENEIYKAGSGKYRLKITPPPTPTPIPTPKKTPIPTGTRSPTPTETPTEPAPVHLVQVSAAPGRLHSMPLSSPSPGRKITTTSGKKRGKWPKPHIMLKKGKSKTGMRYIKIKITKYKGKYVQIFLRQKHRKYKKIKLKSPVLKKKKSFKLAYTRRQVKLWFRVRTYAKSGGKRYYSPYSKAKGVVL